MKMQTIIESFERFVKEKRATNLTGTDIEEARISVAKLIDSVLQRPSNNGKINKLLRAKTPGVTKKDANLLLYLYKGMDEMGNLLEEENVGAVEEELGIRAQNFLDSFETEDQFSVFLADAPSLIKSHLPMMRKKAQKDSHQSKYMLKTAPGSFSDFYFARMANRAVFKDTTANSGMKDFMHKDSPELKNINPEHNYLFRLEYLIQIAYDMITDGLYGNKTQPITEDPLTNDVFVKNYIMGISQDAYDAKQKLDKEEHPTFGPIIDKQRQRMNHLFRYFYYGKHLRDPLEQQIQLVDDYMPKILDIDNHQVKNNMVPKYSILLSLVWKELPPESQKKYELPFLKIIYTAKNSEDIEYDINVLIREKGVLENDKFAGSRTPVGLAGETENYLLNNVTEDLDSIISLAEKGNTSQIPDMWKNVLLSYNRLNKQSKDSLSDKLATLRSLLEVK